MAKEIERKFLVANEAWRAEVSREEFLRDGLIAYVNDRKVRIRLCDDRAFLTIKGPRTGISRDEFEYEIPMQEGLVLLEEHCGEVILTKRRHYVPFEGFEWTIDEYQSPLQDVVLAEIELTSESVEFPVPPWLGNEVTGAPEYRKINMLKARQRQV